MKYSLAIITIILLQNNLEAQEGTRTIATDSSTVIIEYYKSLGKIVSEHLKERDFIHETLYYPNDSTIMKQDYYTDNSRHSVGISKSFDQQGNLKLTIDHDKAIWFPADTSEYPNYPILKTMKLKGDSIIKSIYGDKFFKDNVRWNIYSSYYFDKTYQPEPSFTIEWLRDGTKNKYKATEFNIRYDIIYGNERHERAIQIIIDRNGQLLASHLWNENWTIYNQGLEKFSNTSIRNLILTNQEAIRLAKQFGLQEKDSSKVWSELIWEPIKDSTAKIFNGHFRIYVTQRLTSKSKRKKSNHRTEHFYVWVFNPWTKEFINKKTMHRDYNAGYFGGLTDD